LIAKRTSGNSYIYSKFLKKALKFLNRACGPAVLEKTLVVLAGQGVLVLVLAVQLSSLVGADLQLNWTHEVLNDFRFSFRRTLEETV